MNWLLVRIARMLAVAALSVVRAEVDSESTESPFAQEILALANAENLTRLDRVCAGVPKKGAAQIVYAVRRFEIVADAMSERSVIKSIPATAAAFKQFHRLFEVRELERDKEVKRIAGDYFKTVAGILSRRRDLDMAPFLRLSAFADGELKDDLDGWVDLLRTKDPARFRESLKRLEPKVRGYVCQGCEIVPRQ